MSGFDWGESANQGRRDVRVYLGKQQATRDLRLSRYSQGRLRDRLLRASLLASRIQPRLLKPLARLLLSALPESVWAETLADYSYWSGVRLELERQKALAPEGVMDPEPEWQKVRGSGVPILLYHRIVLRHDAADPKYAISDRRFRAQMRLLRQLDYRTINLRELVDCHLSGRLPPARSVVVTFDDGYRDNAPAARYMLANGQIGTIFLVTGRMGCDRDWTVEGLGQMPLLSWDEVRELRKAGFEFGSHTRTHLDLSTLEASQAWEEINMARADMLTELGEHDHLFAYPYGGSSLESRALVARAGYLAACGVRRGLSDMHDDPFYLRRITIYGDENLLSFAVRVVLGDNPLDYLPWGRAREWKGKPTS